MKPMKRKEFLTLLVRDGWVLKDNSKHILYENLGYTVAIPHGRDEISPGTLRDCMRVIKLVKSLYEQQNQQQAA